MRNIFILASTLALTASLASAQAPNDSNPDWLRKPSPAELYGVWPAEAFKRGVEGRAEIECKVSLDGALFDCVASNEKPAGMGFGTAALALAPRFLMKPAIRNGVPVVVTVKVPIFFLDPPSETAKDHTLPDVFTKTILSNVPWLEAPTYREVAAAYPAKARDQGLAGRATFECTIRGDGRLGDCANIVEDPGGQGFARAAKALTERFRAPTQLENGKSTRGMSVTVPFAFSSVMLATTPRIGKPNWIRLPSLTDVQAAFPKPTGSFNVLIVLDCEVGSGGNLGDCKVESETPPGGGLGEAALKLANRFAVSTWTDEGLPTLGGRVRAPIRYKSD